MNSKSPRRLSLGILLAASSWGCSGDYSGQGGDLGTTELEVGSWSGSNFTQILRVNQAETTVRNRCELTIPLSAAKPMTIIASVSGAVTSVGWTGSAVSVPGLSVTGCAGYPCDVVATSFATGSNMSTQGCQIIADDGATRVIGTSSGTALTVYGAPATPVIYHQHMDAVPSGVTGTCILRQNDQIAAAQVTDFQVLLNGAGVVNLGGSTNVGNVAWPTKLQSTFGVIYVGSEIGATRLKHVAPVQEQLTEGDALQCSGTFSDGSIPVFDVNVSGAAAGNGMSLQTAATGWTCSAALFGAGNGCDCDCGVMDPDCGTHDCTHIAVSASSGQDYTINGAPDPVLDLVRGRTYVFDNSSMHPFAIHTVQGQTSQTFRYNDGVTGQGATSATPPLKFTPPLSGPSPVYYQCELHAPMTGPINLLNP